MRPEVEQPEQYATGEDLLIYMDDEPVECWDEVDEIREEQRLIRQSMMVNPWEGI